MQKQKKQKKKPQIMEKIHQLVLSLKWSNGRLKIPSAMTLKIPMGTFGEHFKFLES